MSEKLNVGIVDRNNMLENFEAIASTSAVTDNKASNDTYQDQCTSNTIFDQNQNNENVNVNMLTENYALISESSITILLNKIDNIEKQSEENYTRLKVQLDKIENLLKNKIDKINKKPDSGESIIIDFNFPLSTIEEVKKINLEILSNSEFKQCMVRLY